VLNALADYLRCPTFDVSVRRETFCAELAATDDDPAWHRRCDPHVDSIFANNRFLGDLLEWRHSPEGQQFVDLADALCDLMEDVQLDAKQPKFILARWTTARSRSVSCARSEAIPRLPLRLDRGILDRLDRHGLRPGTLVAPQNVIRIDRASTLQI
jgi:hypothetical protein